MSHLVTQQEVERVLDAPHLGAVRARPRRLVGLLVRPLLQVVRVVAEVVMEHPRVGRDAGLEREHDVVDAIRGGRAEGVQVLVVVVDRRDEEARERQRQGRSDRRPRGRRSPRSRRAPRTSRRRTSSGSDPRGTSGVGRGSADGSRGRARRPGTRGRSGTWRRSSAAAGDLGVRTVGRRVYGLCRRAPWLACARFVNTRATGESERSRRRFTSRPARAAPCVSFSPHLATSGIVGVTDPARRM